LSYVAKSTGAFIALLRLMLSNRYTEGIEQLSIEKVYNGYLKSVFEIY